MSQDDLDQALFVSKWGDAEEDGIEVIARALDTDPVLIERVLYAAAVIRKKKTHTQLLSHIDDGENISVELGKAIQFAIDRGWRRSVVRYALQNDSKIAVKVGRLTGNTPVRICAGCPFIVDCAVKSYSTPERCVKAGPPKQFHERSDGTFDLLAATGGLWVTPLWIRGDAIRVTCDHPKGEWTLDIMDIKV